MMYSKVRYNTYKIGLLSRFLQCYTAVLHFVNAKIGCGITSVSCCKPSTICLGCVQLSEFDYLVCIVFGKEIGTDEYTGERIFSNHIDTDTSGHNQKQGEYQYCNEDVQVKVGPIYATDSEVQCFVLLSTVEVCIHAQQKDNLQR